MELHRLRAVVFQEQGFWVAQILEFDIAAQAREFRDILYELEKVVVSRVMFAKEHGLEAFKGLPQAPKRYWEMFESAVVNLQSVDGVRFISAADDAPELEFRAA